MKVRRVLSRLGGDVPRLDGEVALATVVSTTVLVLTDYHTFAATTAGHVVTYAGIPLLIILLLRRDPRDYGVRLGDWRAGLALVAVGIAVTAPVVWFLGTRNASMHGYYAGNLGGSAAALVGRDFFELAAWEFFFRGWLLSVYVRRFGADGIWLQAVPFAFAHLGKPEIETLSTIFGGFAFGWVAWRTRSFLYPALIHWFLASFVVLVASGVFG